MSDDREKKRGGGRLQKGDAPTARTHKRKKRTGKALTKHRLMVAGIVVAAILVVGVIGYNLLVQKPVLPDPSVDIPITSGGIAADTPNSSGRKNDSFFTFLIAGRDTGGGGNTDTIMVASYDVVNQKAMVMNIPRDTMVNVPWDVKRINSVYGYAESKKKSGIEALKVQMKDIIGFVPDFHVVIEWEGFGKLVEAIGGVNFDVPINMDYDDPTQNLHIHVKKGQQKLNAEQAMGVIRFRDGNNNTGYKDGDIGRIRTQQNFLKALISQVLQPKNLINIDKFAAVFNENVETDLSVQNLIWFAKSALTGGLSGDAVEFNTMPYTGVMAPTRTYGMQSFVTVKVEEQLALVNGGLNPFKRDVTAADLDIMSYKNGKFSSSTGTVKDGKAGTGGSSTPKATPKPEVPTQAPTPSPAVSPNASPSPDASQRPGTSPAPSSGPSVSPSVSVSPSASPTPTPEPTPTPMPTPEPTPTPTPTPDPDAPPEGIPLT